MGRSRRVEKRSGECCTTHSPAHRLLPQREKGEEPELHRLINCFRPACSYGGEKMRPAGVARDSQTWHASTPQSVVVATFARGGEKENGRRRLVGGGKPWPQNVASASSIPRTGTS